MRKFSKSKKAAILASIMGGWMIGGSAFAANLLITVPSDYGASNMTAITGSRVTDKVDSKANVAVIESLNKDPGTYSFVLDGKSMFLLRQYNYSTVDLIPSKVIGADTTWSKDEVYPSGIITKGANPHSAAGHNGYIYVGDYDLGTIGVVKYDKNVLTEEISKSRNLIEDLNNYCGMSYSSPGWVHGEGMVVKNGQLYVVVSINPKGGYDPYDDSIIMQYQIKDDGSLEYVNYTCSARNPDSVKLNNYNDILLHTGIGGYQYVGHGNSESAITLATINNNVLNQESKSVVLPENVKSNGLDFRDMTVWPNGTAYILAYNLATGGGGSNLKVYKTTVANLSSDNPVDWEIVVEGSTEGGGNTGVGTGWFNKLFAEYYTKRVWAEFGNNIVVYTDGAAKPTYTWSAYELAGNTSYHTFNSVSLLSGDTVFGNKALLTTSREEGLTSPSVTTTKIVNINANSKTGDYFQRISGTDADTSVYSGVSSDNSVYTFTADKTISLKPNAWKTQADLSNNILAAVYAHDGNDVTVNAGSNTLQLQVQNSVATPVGVYAGNGKNITINAGKLNIITIGAVNGNSLNNAIMNDAGKSAASKITVNGDINISMNGSYGGNGVAVQKTDRWGEASYASDVANTITINGNLTIKGSDSETWGIPINADNVLSRFNNAGILAQVENSRVDVSGTADMDVYGNGITTNAKNSTVSIGGGEINVPKGMNYGYYTLGAYQGTINVNTGKDGTAAGNNSVKLGGDIFALKTGTVNVALTTDDSYLRGIVDNGGTVNMWLQNGASWINQANNTRYAQDNEDVGSNGASHISKLTGGSACAAGVIFQKSGSKDITIDKYSGNTMVIYEHDNSNPENILGGNFTVKTAETGSAVALRTDSNGINTSSEATVNKVLDALANKLYYTDYVNGSRNLDGQVQIAEGLTAASAAKYVGSVKYSDTTGQGSLGEKISVQTETPEGDNTDADKNFLLEKGDWHGNNSGDNVNLALKDKASWTGNNSGSNMVVNAADSAWTGDNKGAGTNVTLNASAWNGKNDGSKAVVTLKNKASWTGDSSGSDLQLTLDNSAYQGNIRGDRSSVTLNNGSSWSGNVIGSGSTLNMHGDSLWQLKGDNVLDSFNAGSISKMRKATAVAAGGGTTVDMTDATAGNLTINKYNGKATFVYQHDVNDVTKINGGDITIGTATTGSRITLLTDSNGLETTNKYAINDALNALANKLYYTGYLNGEKNLDGYVKIAEGLTSASATKFAGNIGYDSKTGQGSLDKATVDYGTSIPNVQSKTDFKTTVTGDYVTDREYRDAGVLPDTDNIYNFTKDATTITTAGSAITTAKDTTLKLNNNDMTITASSGDGIATTGGTLTVQNAGNFAVTGAKAINANNSKVEITAVNATLNGDVSTNNVVNIKATKAAKINGAVSANGANSNVSISGEATTITGAVAANGANSNVSINGTASAAISGAVGANGANAAVTIDSADTTIGSDVIANGQGAKVTAKNLSKLNGNVATDADGSVELKFKEGASWTGDNSGNTTMSLSKGTWNGANTGKLNATLTNGTTWTGDSSGAGSTIKLDASTWNGANSGANANVTLTNGASWSKGNTADGVTVKADKASWSGANGGANANITLTNSASWTGANTGANATFNLTDSSWSGDNSGAGLSLTADNSKWNGSTNTAGSATLTNGSIWNGASTSADFSLTLNGSTWNNSGASSLNSFNGTNGIVDMTNAAASVTIGSYSGDATVIYKHNSSNPAEVYGGNFTVNKAAANSKITMLTDNTGVDTTDEDKINEALDALAGKLFYTGAIGGAENNLNGTVKIAEGLTATSVAKQTAGIVYDKTTGQGSADHKTVTPGPVYPTEQDRTAFVTSITGEHLTDKEYRKAGVLSNTVDNNIYNFTKDATTITTAGSAVTTAKDTTLKLNNNDMTITANSGDGIATSGGKLTVQDAGSFAVTGAKAINANNSKVEITAVNATLNGDVSTNNVVNIKATKAAKVNGAVSASGANSNVSINGTDSVAITGAVNADGANSTVTIDSADTTIGSDVTANGKGAKVTAKNLSKLDGDVITDANGSVELGFKEGAAWSGDNAGNTTMSLSKGTWNGANTGKLNATLTNGTSWTGDSSGAGSTIKLDGSAWSGANSGANTDITLNNGASWSKGNTADGVTVKADKAAWTGANGGAKANITLSNSASWNGANTGSNATVNLKDSSWSGDNSGAGLSLTANNSKWNGSTSTAGSAVLTNGSIWNGASTSGDFSLTLNNSTWNNSGASSLKSFTGTNGVVDMTNAAAGVTIGSYSGDATVIYKHNSSNPAEVYGGNFTVNKAAANSKITMLTDNTGVDTTDEDKINEALDALAGKLFYTGAIGGAENNLNGTVKIAEGLTATSVAKQTAGIVYDKTTGQGSADHKTVTPGPVYPTEQDRTAFVTSITGEHLTDKEYRKAGVLSNTVDNNIYNFTKDATTITTDSSAITTAKDTTFKLNNHDLTITASSGDGIATTGGTLTVQNAGSLTVSGAKAINANNSKVEITAVNATLNGDVTTNDAVTLKATKAAKVNGAVSASGANSSVSINGTASAAIRDAVSADGANAAVTIDSADTTIGSDITANGKGAKVTAKNLSKLDGDVTTDAESSVELTFKEDASWSGDNSGNTTMSLSKGIWNGANTGKLNATLTNGTTWTGDSSGSGSTIKLDASSWSGANSGANADITLNNGASWSKGNTADGVTVKADKAAWTGANGGAKANITLSNSASWNGANTGSNATVNLKDSSWSGDNSGAGLSLTANNSKWNGSTSTAGSAVLTNGSIWNGASTSGDFSLTLNNSTWNNSGASSLKSFTGTNGVVDMTNAAAGVTIGSYSGDATVIYKHNSSNPAEVYGGNFTVTKATANSKITMLTDRSGVDFSDEDSIANALNSLANKLYYTGYITGERNLTGYVKLAEGLTASSVVKQTGDIAYDKTTGQGSLKDGSVTPNVTYPEEQTKDNFTSQITGEWKQDKEYKLAGVLHTDNAVYDFSKDRSIITTAGTSVGAGRDLQLQLNNKSMSLNSGADAVKADAITIEFKNLDKLDIKAAGQALLAENGGKIILHNTGVVTADSAFIANGAGSSIKADGLTNITVGSGDAVKADAGSIELAGSIVKGAVTADNKGKISINANNNAAGSKLTDITGNVLAASGSNVDIGLGTAESKLTGDVSTAGDAVINIYADMGIWTGNADGDNVNLNLNSSKAQWNNIGNSKLRSLKGNGGIINQTDANAGNIDVGDYSGNVVVNYKHTADKDTASNTLNNIKFGGGSLNIDKVAEGSSITLRTDNSDNLSYTETDNIEKLFRELSKKLYYADAGSNPDNLSGHVEIAEGLTKVKVYGDINYGEHGQGNYKDGSIKRTDPEIIYGSSETAMMRGAKSAMASTALLWRSENSDMLQRMGDVRLDNEESGLWARYYGGKNSFDAKNTKYSTSFNAYQLGYDKKLDNNMLFGAAVSYNKGKNTYEMGGHGDGKAVSLSVYGSWNSDKGHYADVIVKGGKLDNDYTVYNDMGHKLEGDYDTWGLSLSAEYGRRMQMQNGFYIDPSVQFTVGRIAGADYSAASDFLDSKGLKKDMYVSQDAFTSAIGRIGLGMGKTTDKAMFYTKFALAHEFSGDFTTTFAAENEPTSSTAVDFGGTWFEWQLGGSMKVNDNSYVYATFEKKFGGDTGSNDWRLDAGLRWSF